MAHNNNLKKKKFDPSDTKQQIIDIQIHLLCGRYWVLKEWECVNMASPFWRLYHNTLPGAHILFRDTWIELHQDTLVLIPPHTAFATSLKRQLVKIDNENIAGRRWEPTDILESIRMQGLVDHLFVHFNLGMSYDIIETQIFSMTCESRHLRQIDNIKKQIIANPLEMNNSTVLAVNILILEMMTTIPAEKWSKGITDRRVIDAISFMRDFDLVKVSNEELASRANMATNAFARLFKENTSMTIQQYLMKIRIEKACLFMHHSSHSIDDIAHRCGFFDRHHFSKAFKQALNVTPAYYMKKLTMIP